MTLYQLADPDSICPISRNSRREDLACVGIQSLGLLLALGGVATLVALAGAYASATKIVSFSIYGATLIALYAFSTLYHASRRPKRKQFLAIVDQSSIYLLIAGTYTPLMLVTLAGGWGWSLFGVVWGMALLGVSIKVLFHNRFEAISLTLYLVMGWLVVIGFAPLLESLPTGGIWLIFAAGVTYTAGVPVYLWKRMPYNHAMWHMFVLGGSSSFYFAFLFYVLPES